MAALMASWRSSGLLPRRSTRQWIRLDNPVLPYVWGGLLPSVGLALLTHWAHGPFAFNDIEATVRSEIRSQLDAKAHGWAHLLVTGQEVVLTGSPPSPTAGDAALAVARAATCPSAIGRLTCAVSVTGAFAAVQAPAAVPGSPAPPLALPQAVAALNLRNATECEAALADVLRQTKIAFASSSAQLDDRSAGVINRLAGILNGCSGQFRIEGHTDAQGSPDANRALSLERAAAVRAALITRGVVPGRLIARGAGADRPLADNSTESGRAMNRRIEFKAVTDHP